LALCLFDSDSDLEKLLVVQVPLRLNSHQLIKDRAFLGIIDIIYPSGGIQVLLALLLLIQLHSRLFMSLSYLVDHLGARVQSTYKICLFMVSHLVRLPSLSHTHGGWHHNVRTHIVPFSNVLINKLLISKLLISKLLIGHLVFSHMLFSIGELSHMVSWLGM
jgi:hypothetical protein